MATFQGDIYSRTLDMRTGLTVILPHDRRTPSEKPVKTLYLLHGLSGACRDWIRGTSIERYADDHNLAVVMPEVQRSFYLDLKYGLDYFTYVSDELPKLCAQMFQIPGKREDTYVAGLSMGGYGAMKCALRRPDVFSKCASFSAAFDLQGIVDMSKDQEGLYREMQAYLGGGTSVSAGDDLFALAKECMHLEASLRPKLFITCGTEDFLYPVAQAFTGHLKQIGMEFGYEEWPGVHEWGFWDKSIQLALDYFEQN